MVKEESDSAGDEGSEDENSEMKHLSNILKDVNMIYGKCPLCDDNGLKYNYCENCIDPGLTYCDQIEDEDNISVKIIKARKVLPENLKQVILK